MGKRYEVAPKRRMRRKSSGWWLWIPLGVVVVALVGIGAYFGARAFGLRGEKGWFGGPLAADGERRYLPDDVGYLEDRRLEDIRTNPYYQKLRAAGYVGEVDKGWDYENYPGSDVERITIAGGKFGDVKRMYLKQGTTAADVLRMNQNHLTTWTDEKVDGYTVSSAKTSWNITVVGMETRSSPNLRCFCVPERKTLLFGHLDAMRPMLRRKGGPTLSATMEELLAAVDQTKPLVKVFNDENSSTLLPVDAQLPMGVDVTLTTSNRYVRGRAMQLEIGPDVITTMTFLCVDVAAAEALKKHIEGGTKHAIEEAGGGLAADLFKDRTCTVNGPSLVVRKSQSVDLLIRWCTARPNQGRLRSIHRSGPGGSTGWPEAMK